MVTQENIIDRCRMGTVRTNASLIVARLLEYVGERIKLRGAISLLYCSNWHEALFPVENGTLKGRSIMKEISVTSKFRILTEQLYPDDVITIYDGIYNIALVTGECVISIWVFGEQEWVFVSEFSRSESHAALQLYNSIKQGRTPSISQTISEEQPCFVAKMTDINCSGAIPF